MTDDFLADRHDDCHPGHWCVRREVSDGRLERLPGRPMSEAEAEGLAAKLNESATADVPYLQHEDQGFRFTVEKESVGVCVTVEYRGSVLSKEHFLV